MPPTVAIIMRAFNEMPHVAQVLDMLKKQTFSDFEFFAVDSGSTDGTLEALIEVCEPGHLTRIAPEEYIPGKVINEAVRRTDHEITVLLNADAIPRSNDWLERLIAPLLDDRADASYSRQIPRSDARFIVAYDYRRAYNPSKVAPAFYSAVACAFRREVWERHKFPEYGYAEDTIWAGEFVQTGGRILLAAGS
jgi:glycosyltransferase involved in cell wall biosynthesis